MKKGGLFWYLLLLAWLFWAPSAVAFFGKNYLVKINGKEYTAEDFKKWWSYWKEPGMTVPATPDPFIDWILISDEAKTMGLDQEPSYQKKLKTFLEVRALMQLRYDEIDQKIDLSRKTLWQEYVRNYTPRLRVKALITSQEKEAKEWVKEAQDAEKFLKLFQKLEKTGKAKDFGWERPYTIPKELRDSLLNAKEGEILGPLAYKGRFYVIYVEKRLGPDPEDFKALKEIVAHRYKKRKARELTQIFIKKLRQKYPVQVNEALLDQITLEDLPQDLADKPVLVIGDKKLTAKEFQTLLKKEAKLRIGKNKKVSQEELAFLKKRLINDIIAQTLTSWEALNRHYEQNVLKDIYEFYKRQRLVREFEEKIIWPQIKVTDEEVRKYYETHKKDFTRPARVEMAVIKTQDEQLARQIYQRLKRGEDFFEVAKEIQFHGARPERHELSNLVPEMREIVQKMKPGEVSSVIKIKDWYCIVKLIRFYPEEVHPFEMVKESIRKTLAQEKFEKMRAKYVAQLRAKSDIKINQKAWQKLRRELEAENGS